jgi:hypothetical protein
LKFFRISVASLRKVRFRTISTVRNSQQEACSRRWDRLQRVRSMLKKSFSLPQRFGLADVLLVVRIASSNFGAVICLRAMLVQSDCGIPGTRCIHWHKADEVRRFAQRTVAANQCIHRRGSSRNWVSPTWGIAHNHALDVNRFHYQGGLVFFRGCMVYHPWIRFLGFC